MIKRILIVLTLILNFLNLQGEIALDSTVAERPPVRLTGLCRKTIKNNHPLKDSLNAITRLVFHLGANMVYTNGIINLSPDRALQKNIDFEKNLGFPHYAFSPRINIEIKTGKKSLFLVDLYGAFRSKKYTLTNDLYLLDKLIPAYTNIGSRFHLLNIHIAYRYSIIKRGSLNIGAVAGVSVFNYYLSVKNETFSIRENIILPMPMLGIEGIYSLSEKLYLRFLFKFAGSPFDKWNYSMFSIKPGIEYFFSRKLGIGFKYHYSYNQVDNLVIKNFHGPFLFHSHIFSLYGCLRIF